MLCPVSSGYLVYFTRPMTMHRAVSPTEPTPRWVPGVTLEVCCCNGQEKITPSTGATDPQKALTSSVRCALDTERLVPYIAGPYVVAFLQHHLKHCSHLGSWRCWCEPPGQCGGWKLLKVWSHASRSLSALSAYHSGLITPMKIRTETPGNLRLYSGSPTRSEKEQVSISSFYYKERVSTRPKCLS